MLNPYNVISISLYCCIGVGDSMNKTRSKNIFIQMSEKYDDLDYFCCRLMIELNSVDDDLGIISWAKAPALYVTMSQEEPWKLRRLPFYIWKL